MRSNLKGETVGIFTMDPGQTTGLGFGVLKLEGSIEEIFARGEFRTAEVSCMDPYAKIAQLSELDGADRIVRTWLRENFGWNSLNIPSENRFFVYEDFNLRGRPGSLKRSGLSPVRVTSAVQGMLYGEEINWIPQQPADAKTRWTTDRMKRVGLWVVGSEHQRDAARHAGLWVARQLSSNFR